MARAVLFDATLCVGCRECESACAKRWGNPYNEQIAAQEKLSAQKLTTIRTVNDHSVRKLCMHCLEPTCVSVCPVGALQKTKAGPVVYLEDRCIGCRYCMEACPFGSISYTWNERVPKIRKCDFCATRKENPGVNACAEACPTGASLAGERDELVKIANQRLAESPDQYFQKIYGMQEAGGTSVLYISPVPFEQLGLNTSLPDYALPTLTWRVLSHVPDVGAVGSVLLGGIWWITHRREAVAKAEGRPAPGARNRQREGVER